MMNKCGFIGYGSMGSMLVNGFLTSGVLTPERVLVSNRNMEKTDNLRLRWPEITITDDNRKASRESDLLFVCVRPLDFLTVLNEIKSDLGESTHLVSIAACITIGDIERQFSGRITKVIPSITSEVNEGISLICHNAKVSNDQKERVERLLRTISTVVGIRESDFEAAADLTSCAPGLIAAIIDNFVQAGIRHSDIPADVARMMVVSTLFGTAKLMSSRGIEFSEMIGRVATRGGITEEGVKVLNHHLPAVFDEVFIRTLSKHDSVKEKIASLQTVFKSDKDQPEG